MDAATPDAIQVANRFHLVKNLSDYLEQALRSYRAELKSAERAQHRETASVQPEATVVVIPQPTATASARQTLLENQKRRVQLQQKMRELRTQMWTHAAIAQEVGVGNRTVERYLAAPDFSEVPNHYHTFGSSILDQMAQQHPDLASIVEISNGFLQLLRQRQSDKFDDWLLKALTSSIKPLQTFAKGLLNDYAAVKASMTTEVSNGPVEGLNNKLKMLKRQMYGRAGLELLTKRFITPVSDY